MASRRFLTCVATVAMIAQAGMVLATGEGGALPPYTLLKPGEVMPCGWLLRQMELDLREGIAGGYDRISGNVAQNLFAAQVREPGSWIMGSRGIKEKAWWAGEHEGYWMDGFIRMAILTGNQPDLDQAKGWVERILARVEETGYIGIYSPETRFPDKGFDGEFWTQSRTFQGLLAWYEYTGDPRVLSAVERGVHATIDHYRDSGTYFIRPGVDGGVTHGVAYMDTLEWLWRLTGDQYYAVACGWLYADFCRYPKADMNSANLLDAEKLWQDHTPHTAEGLHMPGIVGFLKNDPGLKKASENMYLKLARHTNPGGGFVAGKLEAIAGAYGGGDEGNEYCAKTEGICSLNRLFMYEGNLFSGDWSEKCALNAAQGARFHPANTGVIYLSRDNRLSADQPSLHGGREVFSAAHRTAACCTLNSIRLLPAYVEGMWFRSTQKPELLANLYGASELNTEIGGQRVKIIQETDYPFSSRVAFRIETAKPLFFELALRVPPNSGKVGMDAGPQAQVSREGRLIRISKTWNAGDAVNVDFDFQVNRREQHDGKQAYYEWGPLVFALPIPDQVSVREEIVRAGAPTGFNDWIVKPASTEGWDYILDPDSVFKKVDLAGDPLSPWTKPVVGLKGTLLNGRNEKTEVTLHPLGSTLLRRTTFPLTATDAAPHTPDKAPVFKDEDDPMRTF
ncbi:MAG: glycoside hydrolase family 127 protein [Kiritimatiellales bacterium]|nr:glycoside hydrolase family 127 protein [Kiritimatiellales bacterium]